MDIKIFLDTNIILDLLDEKRPFHKEAVDLFARVENGDIDAFISESVLSTTDYILCKLIPKQKRIAVINDLLNYTSVLPLTKAVCQKALKSPVDDFEDALLYQMAIENNLDYFVSNDSSFLKKSLPALPVISTKNLLKEL